MRDEFSLEQKLEAMLTVALEPISAEELADVLEVDSPDVAEWVAKFANRDISHRLSSAALETLAIIAYRQPISRAQITALRGVNVDGVSRLLEQRGYIEEQGRASSPGQPILYATTELFLDRMGLATLTDLPPIEEFMPPLETANALADEMSEGLRELAEEL